MTDPFSTYVGKGGSLPEVQIEAFVEHYSQQRYHENLNDVTPADAHLERAETIIKQREAIERQTIEHRRLQHHKLAA